MCLLIPIIRKTGHFNKQQSTYDPVSLMSIVPQLNRQCLHLPNDITKPVKRKLASMLALRWNANQNQLSLSGV